LPELSLFLLLLLCTLFVSTRKGQERKRTERRGWRGEEEIERKGGREIEKGENRDDYKKI
jgi:hypothetical protein